MHYILSMSENKISPAVAEKALDDFCKAFPEELKILVEVRVIVEPELVLRVGIKPGTTLVFPARLPGNEQWAIRVVESDARVVTL